MTFWGQVRTETLSPVTRAAHFLSAADVTPMELPGTVRG